MAEIDRALQGLMAVPQLGWRREALPPSIRGYSVGSHIVIYRLRDPDMVQVLAVLHQAMDISSRSRRALRAANKRDRTSREIAGKA